LSPHRVAVQQWDHVACLPPWSSTCSGGATSSQMMIKDHSGESYGMCSHFTDRLKVSGDLDLLYDVPHKATLPADTLLDGTLPRRHEARHVPAPIGPHPRKLGGPGSLRDSESLAGPKSSPGASSTASTAATRSETPTQSLPDGPDGPQVVDTLLLPIPRTALLVEHIFGSKCHHEARAMWPVNRQEVSHTSLVGKVPTSLPRAAFLIFLKHEKRCFFCFRVPCRWEPVNRCTKKAGKCRFCHCNKGRRCF